MAIDKKNSPAWYRVVVWIVLAAFVLGMVGSGVFWLFNTAQRQSTLGTGNATTSSQETTAQAQIAEINAQFQAQIATKQAAQKAKPNDFATNSELGLAYSSWAQALQATGDVQALSAATARYTDAVPYLKTAYGLKPTDTATANAYVVALALSGQQAQATTVAREVTVKNSGDAEAWYNLGSLLANSGEANATKDALAAFRTAIEKDTSGAFKASAQQQIDTLSSTQ